MHARSSLDDDEDYRSSDRDEDYQDDDDSYDEMVKELKDEDHHYGDDSQEEEELQDEYDTDGTVIINSFKQETPVSERS